MSVSGRLRRRRKWRKSVIAIAESLLLERNARRKSRGGWRSEVKDLKTGRMPQLVKSVYSRALRQQRNVQLYRIFIEGGFMFADRQAQEPSRFEARQIKAGAPDFGFFISEMPTACMFVGFYGQFKRCIMGKLFIASTAEEPSFNNRLAI
uniref:Uncharacterized protein n=1 Tax=Ascaris lumbricoides TaxID=6252 RepID=A0A9J2PAS7_ASCLU